MNKIIITLFCVMIFAGCNWGGKGCPNCSCDKDCCGTNSCSVESCSCSCK